MEPIGGWPFAVKDILSRPPSPSRCNAFSENIEQVSSHYLLLLTSNWQVTDDLESWAESRQKMAGYFANVASRKRSAAAGQVSDAVAAAKEQVVRKNAAIKQEAHQIREAELAKYAADRKKSRKEASAFVPPGKLECVPPGKLERLGPTLGDSERVRSAKPHKINLGSNGQGGLGLQNNSRPSTSSSWSRQDTHGTSSRPNSRGSVDIATKMTKSSKTRTRIGGGGSGVVPHRREVTSNKHVGQIMDAGAWEQIDGSHEGELGFFQQKLRQAQVQAYAGDANGGRLDGNAAFNWQVRKRNVSEIQPLQFKTDRTTRDVSRPTMFQFSLNPSFSKYFCLKTRFLHRAKLVHRESAPPTMRRI